VFALKKVFWLPPPTPPHPLTGANPRTTAKIWWRGGEKKYDVHFRMDTPFEPGPTGMAHNMNEVHTVQNKFLILLFHLHLSILIGLFPSSFLPETWYIFLLFPTCATCLVHLILLYFITQITFSEKHHSGVSHLLCFSRLQLLPLCQVLNTIFKCKMQFSP